MKEEWKVFKSSGCIWEVSTLGRIKKHGELYQPYYRGGHKGSKYLCTSSIEPYGGYIHRIVANTFIPNPENKKTVNHIDGNKSNNAVSNLEWLTHNENYQHARQNGLYPKAMSIEERNKKYKDNLDKTIKQNKINRSKELEYRNNKVLEAKNVFENRISNSYSWYDILLEIALFLKERNVKLRHEYISIILPNFNVIKYRLKKDMKLINAYMKKHR